MTYNYWAVRATIVNELDDGVRVVSKVRGEGRIGESVGVRCDRLLEVLGDGLSLVVAQALGVPARVPVWALILAPAAI